MSVESLVEAYETLLGKHKDTVNVSDAAISDEPVQGGKFIASAQAILIQAPDPGDKRYNVLAPRTFAVAAHANPAVAVIIAKGIAVAELVGEPSLPFYKDTQELSTPPAPVAPQPAAAHVHHGAPAQTEAPTDLAGRPVVDRDGKVRCWHTDADGKVCGAEIKEWDGKSPAQLGESRKRRYGLVLCPKHVNIRKKAAS